MTRFGHSAQTDPLLYRRQYRGGPACDDIQSETRVKSIEKNSGVLEHTAVVLQRTMEVLFYATAAFVLVCVMALTAAGVYGIVHDGDDFGVDPGGGGGGGGDVIVPPHLLSAGL